MTREKAGRPPLADSDEISLSELVRRLIQAELEKEDPPMDNRPKPLTSHEIADLLLGRRDNDVMVQVTDDDPAGTVQPYAVSYDPAGDQVVILARRHYA